MIEYIRSKGKRKKRSSHSYAKRKEKKEQPKPKEEKSLKFRFGKGGVIALLVAFLALVFSFIFGAKNPPVESGERIVAPTTTTVGTETVGDLVGNIANVFPNWIFWMVFILVPVMMIVTRNRYD